jgi:site-specific recombinase XerD
VRKLPIVLPQEEGEAVLHSPSGTTWLLPSLLYGSGLRLMECMRLRVKDMDRADAVSSRTPLGDKCVMAGRR